MKNLMAWMLVLIVTLVSSSTTGADAGCRCPVHANGWEHLPDSATVTPDFLYKPYVEVSELLSTDHGIFFYFTSTYRGKTRPTVLAYLLPSREHVGRYVDPEAADRTREVAAQTVSATVKWAAFKNALQRVIGIEQKPGRPLAFNRIHQRPPRIRFSGALITLEWKGHSIPLQGLVDVYYGE